jgi:peptide/nickel transport system substrate-binding protein
MIVFRKSLRWPILLAGVVMLTLALVISCGSAATEAPEAEPTATSAPQAAAPTAAPTTAATAAPAPTTAPAATDAPPPPSGGDEPEGLLTLGLTGYGNEVPIPWQEIAFAKNYGRFIWDYLIGTTDDAQLSTDNGLAESWNMAEDGLSWTFNLREGVPFQNGEEFIAEDMKFVLDQTINIAEAPASYKAQLICCIAENGIEVVNDYEISIRMDKPQIFLDWDLTDAQGNLGVPVDKSHYDAVGEDEYARNPFHTGVYQWTDHLKNDFIELSAWGEHWREGVPLWETIIIKTIPEESTRIAALKTEEVDVINLSRERVTEVEEAGFTVYPRPGQAVIGFYFHQMWEDVPWSDIKVRKAMSIAIDRDEIVEFIFAGRGSPGIVYPMPLSGEVYGGWDRWGPKKDPYPYDPDQARDLLDEAGYPDGFSIKMHSYPLPDAPEGPRLVEALAGYFEAIGIDVEIQPTDSATSIAERLAFNLSETMTFLDAPNRPFPGFAGLMFALEHSEGQGRSAEDPAFDKLIEDMQATLDPVEAERRFLKIHDFIYDEYIHLPVANLDVSYAGNDRIHRDWNLAWRSWEPNYLDLVRRR